MPRPYTPRDYAAEQVQRLAMYRAFREAKAAILQQNK